MICPRCNAKCKKNYCMRCGIMIENGNVEQIKTESIYDERLQNFIGKNYEEIMLRPTNYAAGIFGPFYFLYRKCLLIGILLFIAENILFLFLYNYITSFVAMLLLVFRFIFYSTSGNQIYLFWCKKKLKKISKEKSYLKKSSVSIVFPFIVLAIYVVLIVVLL